MSTLPEPVRTADADSKAAFGPVFEPACGALPGAAGLPGAGLPGIEQLAVLQHLSSPALPIGGFSYSQGLEAAVELRLIHDEASAGLWIREQLQTVMAMAEAPLWCLLFRAWKSDDLAAVQYWNQWFHASRESRELRQETEQMGGSLLKLARELEWGNSAQLAGVAGISPPTLPMAHAFVSAIWRLPETAALSAYIFTWLENQIMAAIKSVPLGQLAGQRVLDGLRRMLPQVVQEALTRSRATPPRLHTLAPQYAIVSARHESQFSRLFRS